MELKMYIARGKLGIKVGISTDPERRRVRLQSDYGMPIELVEIIPVLEDVEQQAHLHLSGHHIHGEWFNCTPDDARIAIHRAIVGITPDNTHIDRSFAHREITEGELIDFLTDAGGEILAKQARQHFYPRLLGHSVRILRARGILEPWSDVLRLSTHARNSYDPQAAGALTTSMSPEDVQEGGVQ
jgi:hypothetical protein